MNLLKTPLHTIHQRLGARMVPFAGWSMPVQYQSIINEHKHVRSQAGLFDISHMGEILISGKNAAKELSLWVTHNLEKSVPGKCSYGFMLTSQGTIMDDLIIYPLEEDRFMLVVNASQKENDLHHLRQNFSSNLKIQDITMETAKLDLQGPEAIDVLQDITQSSWVDLKYFNFKNITFQGVDLLVSRTGYTGELGYELYVPWQNAQSLWNIIIKSEHVQACGLGARDTLRLEAGLPLHGQDLDQSHTPAEGGYEFALKSSAEYLGKNRARNVNELLTGLIVQGRRSPRTGDIVMFQGQKAGQVTSGSFAPSLGHCVALAYINKEYSVNTEFTIERGSLVFDARKTELPFYQGTARMKLN
ncbi:MAG: glycine cleavage system aminomethyltransferase GcvT [Desulfonatronovibrio sp.]